MVHHDISIISTTPTGVFTPSARVWKMTNRRAEGSGLRNTMCWSVFMRPKRGGPDWWWCISPRWLRDKLGELRRYWVNWWAAGWYWYTILCNTLYSVHYISFIIYYNIICFISYVALLHVIIYYVIYILLSIIYPLQWHMYFVFFFANNYIIRYHMM
jgi:hypothetical protein